MGLGRNLVEKQYIKIEVSFVEIVFDIDGIMCDIWTSCERLLKSWAFEFQQGTTDLSLQDYANVIITDRTFSRIANQRYSAEEFNSLLELASFAEGFSFLNSVRDFRMSDLPDKYRHFILEAFGTAAVFENPPPMYNLYNTSLDGVGSYHLTNIYSHNDGWNDRMPYADWGRFLQALAERGHSVTVHTHCFNNACGVTREAWYEREIRPYAPDVKLLVDVGKKKSVIKADVLIEDCLDNILASDARYKIMRSMFHNLHDDYRNAAKWEKAGKPDIICYTNTACLMDLLYRGVERLALHV